MKRKVYPPEYKEKVIRKMHKDKLSCMEAAEYFGLRHKRIQDWEKIYLKRGYSGFYKKSSKKQLLREDSAQDTLELKIEKAYYKKLLKLGYGGHPKASEKMKVIQLLCQKYPLALLLKITKMPRSTYYYHLKKKDQPDKYALVKGEIQAIFEEHKGRYGYRRITMELHQRGFTINHKTVRRLMKEIGLFCRVRRRKNRMYPNGESQIYPNLLDQDFRAKAPNQKWVTDITEFNLFGEKLFLCVILDLYSRDIVSYTFHNRSVMPMVLDAVKKACSRNKSATNLILHSDQGWQYRNQKYQDLLKKKGIRQSMSRKGNPLDNAVIENFFGILKTELLYLQKFQSMKHFKAELTEYLQYYNDSRKKKNLNGLSPSQHRKMALQSA